MAGLQKKQKTSISDLEVSAFENIDFSSLKVAPGPELVRLMELIGSVPHHLIKESVLKDQSKEEFLQVFNRTLQWMAYGIKK